MMLIMSLMSSSGVVVVLTGADVEGITDAVASNGDMSAVGIGFSGVDFADDLRVGDFLAAVGGDGVVVDDKEGVGAVDAFAGAFRVGFNALAETSEFIGVGFIPNLMKLGVLVELTVFKGLACFAVENWHCPFCEEYDGVLAAGS